MIVVVTPSIKHLVIFLAIPVLAGIVFGRQVYLQIFHDLSVWKGGGMGMFASVDAPRQRFLRIYIDDPLGQRILVDQFNSRQRRLISTTRTEPTNRNFDTLSEDLLSSTWVLRREMKQVYRINQYGLPLDEPPELRLAVTPATSQTTSPRQITLGNAWYPAEVRIEYWKIDYDVIAKQLSANQLLVFEAKQRGSGD